MFLVVAVTMAVLLVALAVILNAALFAGNLTARDDGVDDTDPLAYRAAVVDETARLVTYANRNDDTDYTTLETVTQTRIETWDGLAGQHAAASVSGASVGVTDVTYGTLIDQSADRAFTNDAAAGDWTLATGASGVRAFRMDVLRSALTDRPSDESSASALVNAGVFAVELDDGTDFWRVFVYKEEATGEVIVRVEDSTGLKTDDCRAEFVSGRALIDVSNATVAGNTCPQLDFLDGLGSSFAVRYERGTSTSVAGTYSLLVAQDYANVDDPDFADTDVGPSVSYALYSATVDVRYVTPRLRYRTVVEVLPGETR